MYNLMMLKAALYQYNCYVSVTCIVMHSNEPVLLRAGQLSVSLNCKFKVGVLRPVQQPGSYWDRSSALPLVGLEPTEGAAYD